MFSVRSPRAWATLCVAAFFVAAPTLAEAAGVQYTRDRKETLVNKDVGDSRWAITYRLSDGRVTGNVTNAGDRPPSFLDCNRIALTSDNIATFRCYTADPCPERPCSPGQWSFFSDSEIPVSFFLPPGLNPPPSECSNWNTSLVRDKAQPEVCNLTLTIDNSRCDVPQSDFQDVLLNCGGRQIDVTAEFANASVGAGQSLSLPLPENVECTNTVAVVEVTLDGTTKKTNNINCAEYCTPNNDACSEDQECCSHNCDKRPGEDQGICLPQPCLPEGATCDASDECCGQACAPDMAEGSGYICDKDGDCTGLTQSCNSIYDCCAGAVCRSEDNGDFCVAASCKAIGQACDSVQDCCYGNCVGTGLGPDSGGATCVATNCQAVGQYCLSDGDCCDGGACEGTGLGPNSGGSTCVAVSPPTQCTSDLTTSDCSTFSTSGDCSEWLEQSADGDFWCKNAGDGSDQCVRGDRCLAEE